MTKALIALVTLASVNALADEPAPQAAPAPEKKGIFAATAGPAVTTKGGEGSNFSFGGRLGFLVGRDGSSDASVGVAVATMSESATISGVTADATTTFVALEYVGRNAWDTGLYMGARVGLGLYSADVSAGTNRLSLSDNVFAFAPVVGFESPLGQGQARLVIDASWVNLSGGTVSAAGVSADYGSAAALLLHAGLGFNF